MKAAGSKTTARLAKATASVARVVKELTKLIHTEPTCIKCGCQEFTPCDEGCGWTFVNYKTFEALCTACFGKLR